MDLHLHSVHFLVIIIIIIIYLCLKSKVKVIRIIEQCPYRHILLTLTRWYNCMLLMIRHDSYETAALFTYLLNTAVDWQGIGL